MGITLRTIFWALVLLLALSFFGISLQAIVNSPVGQANIHYVSGLLSDLWLWCTAWMRPLI
ncbi:MAG: hypothetical protein PHV99_00875 [Candidatus Pacebacteria bacterium]|nr:hypothetical protein [Candidatus Paceibacterota bacterium]